MQPGQNVPSPLVVPDLNRRQRGGNALSVGDFAGLLIVRRAEIESHVHPLAGELVTLCQLLPAAD
jgi:hypothetical protein